MDNAYVHTLIMDKHANIILSNKKPKLIMNYIILYVLSPFL